MHFIIAFLIGITFITGIIPERTPDKKEYTITADGAGQDQIVVRMEPASFLARKNIITQQYDYSCGSATLCTLLNYGFGETLTEKQVIAGMLQYGNTEMIKKRRAFSLLDMKKFVMAMGYQGTGFKATIDDLRKLNKPCIVPVSFYDYRHFIIVKGVHKGRVFVADPMQGHISFIEKDFDKLWFEHILLLVENGTHTDFSALRLKDEDLRIIDEEITRGLLPVSPEKYTLPQKQELSDRVYYRR